MKVCTRCGVDRGINEFQKDKQKKDGLRPDCKPCRSATKKAERLAMTEDDREKERAYNRTPDRKAQNARSSNKWGSKNKDKLRAMMDKYRLSERGMKKRKEYKKSEQGKLSSIGYVERNRIKLRAQKKARRAVAIGLLTKTGCEVCGNENVHGHHPDYKEPLVVMWLCPKHHFEWHRLNGPGLNGESLSVDT